MNAGEYRAWKMTFHKAPVPEGVGGLLFLNGCQGIYEVTPTQWEVYFPVTLPSDQLAALRERLLNQFSGVIATIEEETVPNTDWNARWRQYFKPFAVTEGLWVRPPWEVLPDNARGIEIIINPQMGFGTGHHESTCLLLQWMMTLPFRGKSVLDVGTGSGILAILAHQLGAKRIVGVDIDADAIANARENIALNNATTIALQVGDIHEVPEEAFDVILANIQLPVLQQLGEPFSRRLTPNGIVLVSGLLNRDAGLLVPEYQHYGLQFEEQRFLGEWVAEMYRKGLP